MKLENERLQISFADAQQIRTQRFDNTAIVTQVVLDGACSFCTSEQVLPGRRTTNGVGLCGEFVLPGAAENAKAGEWFCKPGVGLLRQIEDHLPYDMWKTYEIRPYAVHMQPTDDGVVFRQEGTPCGGYGVDIEKRYRLQENRLILDIDVRNVGAVEICLQEYQHNFVSLAGLPVSEGYVLELNGDKLLREMEGQTLRQGDEIPLPSAVRVQGNEVSWEKNMDGCVLYHRSEEIDPEQTPYWTLHHLRSEASVTEQTGFVPSRVDVWAVEHCVCAEFYHAAHLAPGETSHWQRIWTFEA